MLTPATVLQLTSVVFTAIISQWIWRHTGSQDAMVLIHSQGVASW